MPARLILNADDFGLTPGVNRAIGELASAGVLTSATLMANGPAFDDAVAVAHAHPTLGVGCHIVLADGIPLSPPQSIPSLMHSDGRSFRPSLLGFIQAALRGRILQQDVTREALAQIHKLQHAGIQITHLDTHKHTHLFPDILRPLLEVAEASSIQAIRNPFEPDWSRALNQGSRARHYVLGMIARVRPQFEAALSVHQGRVFTTDGTLAISATGQLNVYTLAQILTALPPSGTYELCCHPGYNDPDLSRVATRLRAHRDTERAALLTEIPRLHERSGAPSLIDYAAITASI